MDVNESNIASKKQVKQHKSTCWTGFLTLMDYFCSYF